MTNSTGADPSDFRYTFSIVILSLFIVVAFFGNALVLFVFAYTKELQTVMNYFLVSLACADLLTAILPLPIWLTVKISKAYPSSRTFVKAWRSMDLTLCTSSIWNLCAISIDRCLAIGWPFIHRATLTPFRMKCAVVAVWVYSLAVSVLITDSVTWRFRGLLISCLSYYIPTVIIVAAYLTIYIAEFRARRGLEKVADSPLQRRSKQDLKMAKYMIVLIASFIVCWAGHFILSTHFAFGGSMVDPFLREVIKGLTYLNSCLNPFLYGYVSPKFRAALLGILRCRGRHTRLLVGEASPIRTSSQRTSSTKLDDKQPRYSRETSV